MIGYSFVHHRRNLKRNGFTIVEVMIVLAIAGLIMLIVFEAIPALTRNGRNNQRKQDVTTILQVISKYELNNSGDFPIACGGGGAPCKTGSNTSLLYYANLTYYDPTTNVITVHPQTELNEKPSVGPENSTTTVDIYDYERCANGGVQGTATSTGADYSDIVALYSLEAATGVVNQCQQL